MTESQLRARLEAVSSLVDRTRTLGRSIYMYIMNCVWEQLRKSLKRLGKAITRADLPLVFDSEAHRYTSQLEIEYNAFISRFGTISDGKGPWVRYRHYVGEFPTGETEHLLHLRRYARLWTLPAELVGGIVGYLAGDTLLFLDRLDIIASDRMKIYQDACMVCENGSAISERTDGIEKSIATYQMIYRALVATLPMPFA